MEVFLNQMGISEESIMLYMQILGNYSLTFSEFKAVLPNIDIEALNTIIDELTNSNSTTKTGKSHALFTYSPYHNYFKLLFKY